MVIATHYPHAPITEAIIDLRVAPREGITTEELFRARDTEEVSYPLVNKVVAAVGQMEVGGRTSASVRSEQIGHKFTTGDGKYIWQARMDGMTLSRLAPYESWGPFRDEARRLWSRYRDIVRPQQIERLAVRYINRIDIPAADKELADYLRTLPEVSADLKHPLTGFFLQLRLSQHDLKAESIINETIVPPPEPGLFSVVLDVDLFRSEEPPQSEEDVWAYFEQLHVRKNEIFEACLTARARELFK